VDMDLGLRGKTFFVTGAASGIGAAATGILAAAGANIGACDRDRGGLDKLSSKDDGSVFPIYADIAEQRDVQNAVRVCYDRFGRIDSMLHFAAILDSTQLDDLTPDTWDKVMAVNLRGTFLVVQSVVQYMREQRGGRIVLTASDSARMGSLVSGPAYAASKGGVIALTHTFALGLGKFNITVNAVCPGLTMTGMSGGWSDDLIGNVAKRTPLGRLAQPEEIARVAIFIGSDAANFMTGEVVEVNGGIHFD
jgi:3-oxoacyl-[acyl-carrier protein] reductase